MKSAPAVLTHSADFMERWRTLLGKVCGFELSEGYAVVRDVLGRRVYSYLPLLNYTDKFSDQLAECLSQLAGGRYIGRALNAGVHTFFRNDPVTMRLPLPASGDAQELWQTRFAGKLRNQIRKSQRGVLRVVRGRDRAAVTDFYRLYRRRMHEYGSPCLDRAVFDRLADYLDASFYLVYRGDDPAAGLVMVRDGQLAWVPWAASDRRFLADCPNHLLYWEAIQAAAAAGCGLFDFGRSPYQGETFRFKQQWGAMPVKVDILKPRVDDPYSKYAAAAALWRRLPAVLADHLGPAVCRHLPDL